MKYSGSLTDIEGIRVGHYTDRNAVTGCTAVIFDNDAVCGVDVRGAAPGTRETDLLRQYSLVEKINAIMLTGGSAFGLACADGAMHFLEEQGKGQVVAGINVPIVPAAVIFDLAIGDGRIRPSANNGFEACANAKGGSIEQGNVGAGTGATIGKLMDPSFARMGGLGSASINLGNGLIVAALIVVNACGDVYDHRSGAIIAGAHDGTNFVNCHDTMLCQNLRQQIVGANTTIGVIATNARLSSEQANRLATVSHDGLALSIRPVHTNFDGDTLFAASCGDIEISDEDTMRVFAAGVECTARAIVNAVS